MLTIKANDSIYQIQNEFSRCFPYLKLGFFRHSHNLHGASAKRDMLSMDFKIKAVLKGKTNSEIIVSEDMPVGALEQLFQERFGLSVQVFRNSGKSWLETTMTDDWTLKHQNEQGEELSMLK